MGICKTAPMMFGSALDSKTPAYRRQGTVQAADGWLVFGVAGGGGHNQDDGRRDGE